MNKSLLIPFLFLLGCQINHTENMENNIYKILTVEQWERAQKTGVIVTNLDQKDGFIHLSTSAQLAGTLSFFFTDFDTLILLQLKHQQPNKALVFEAPYPKGRRSGEFPHLYSDLTLDQIEKQWTIQRGAFVLPEEVLLQAER